MKRITKTEYEKGKDEFYEQKRKDKIPYVRQYKIGLWEVFDGENTIMTGDGGYHQFKKVLQSAVNLEIKKIKDDIRNSS